MAAASGCVASRSVYLRCHVGASTHSSKGAPRFRNQLDEETRHRQNKGLLKCSSIPSQSLALQSADACPLIQEHQNNSFQQGVVELLAALLKIRLDQRRVWLLAKDRA